MAWTLYDRLRFASVTDLTTKAKTTMKMIIFARRMESRMMTVTKGQMMMAITKTICVILIRRWDRLSKLEFG